eukprot:766671-Hanusia_phi.AAC.1
MRMTCQAVEDHNADGPQVEVGGDLRARVGLLGREVHGSPHDVVASQKRLVFQLLRKAKVDELDLVREPGEEVR